MTFPLLSKQTVANARVLVRVSFDVPTDRRGRVLDTFRLERGLPTLRWLIRHQARTVLIAHRGQPHGKASSALSLRPVATALTRLLGRPVNFTEDAPKTLVPTTKRLQPREILLLENLRFDIREERGSMPFAKELAALGDLYVNDDFATSHRSHTSFVLLPKLLPHAAGLNLAEEVSMLQRLLKNVARPFYVILGGAKVHDKLGVVRNLLGRVDGILVGGASASTLLRARGLAVGHSLVDERADRRALLRLVRSPKIFLPSDVVVAKSAETRRTTVVPVGAITPSEAAFDVGPATITQYSELIRSAKTVFWAGPIGLTEQRRFCRGTRKLASSISHTGMFSIAGGGDTIHALHDLGLAKRFSFLSTGGGATLTFLAGTPLPGIEALTP